jgi:hypothetical protein
LWLDRSNSPDRHSRAWQVALLVVNEEGDDVRILGLLGADPLERLLDLCPYVTLDRLQILNLAEARAL